MMNSASASSCALYSPGLTLPNVLWGYIASFTDHRTRLRLSSINHAAQSGTDRTITSIEAERPHPVLARRFKALRQLTLTDCADAQINELAGTLHDRPQLHLRLLHRRRHATHIGLQCLANCRLASICFDQYALNTNAVQSLQSYVSPIELRQIFSITESLTSAMAAIPSLTKISFSGAFYSEIAAADLARHPQLTSIMVSRNQVSEIDLMHLASAPACTFLHCERIAGLAIDAAAALSRSVLLQTLHLGNAHRRVEAHSVRLLAANRSLTDLTIFLASGIEHLTQMVTLQRLTIVGRDDQPHLDADIAIALATLPALTLLKTDNVRFTDDHAFCEFFAASTIATIDMSLPLRAVPAGGLAALAANRRLRSLTLRDSQIGATDAAAIAAHPTLTALSFRGMGFGAAGSAMIHAAWARRATANQTRLLQLALV